MYSVTGVSGTGAGASTVPAPVPAGTHGKSGSGSGSGTGTQHNRLARTQHGQRSRHRCGAHETPASRSGRRVCGTSEVYCDERSGEQGAAAPHPVAAAVQGSAHMTKTEMLQLTMRIARMRLSLKVATSFIITVVHMEPDEENLSHRKRTSSSASHAAAPGDMGKI